ncbi:MAG: hypothetical protein OXT09_18285 [Myxococcales bacterium]|nr:hypothetical protein [Myxococcales bacterium]
MRGCALLCAVLCMVPVAPGAVAASTSGGFDVGRAAKLARELDRQFASAYDRGPFPFFARQWARETARKRPGERPGETMWESYQREVAEHGLTARRLDCTLYAIELLRAGMSERDYRRMVRLHRRIYGQRGFAGWSVAHILTEHFGWTAHVFVRDGDRQERLYRGHFTRHRQYPVWKQPNIRVQSFHVIDRERGAIEAMLRDRRFGWGFSLGGIHTWVTFGTALKEVHFDSGPTRKYDIQADYRMFETTPFVDFHDYGVHLIAFPPG